MNPFQLVSAEPRHKNGQRQRLRLIWTERQRETRNLFYSESVPALYQLSQDIQTNKQTDRETETETKTDRDTKINKHMNRVNLLYDESVPALDQSSQVALTSFIVRLPKDQAQSCSLRDCTKRSQEIVCLKTNITLPLTHMIIITDTSIIIAKKSNKRYSKHVKKDKT